MQIEQKYQIEHRIESQSKIPGARFPPLGNLNFGPTRPLTVPGIGVRPRSCLAVQLSQLRENEMDAIQNGYRPASVCVRPRVTDSAAGLNPGLNPSPNLAPGLALSGSWDQKSNPGTDPYLDSSNPLNFRERGHAPASSRASSRVSSALVLSRSSRPGFGSAASYLSKSAVQSNVLRVTAFEKVD